MLIDRTAPASKLVLATALAVAGVLGFSEPAWAAPPETLRDGLFGDRPMPGRRLSPPVARYVSEEGEAFILDRSKPRPLFKFENNPEVWALSSQPAPRGDVIYKNDLGVPVLRATRLGGLTVFTEARPGGSAAALTGESLPIRLPVLGPQALFARLAQASARATRAARRLISFEAEASPASSGLVADAAIVASEAIARLAARADGRATLSRLSKVRLIEGRRASVSLEQGEMRITISPADGVAGRPSSDRIMLAAGVR